MTAKTPSLLSQLVYDKVKSWSDMKDRITASDIDRILKARDAIVATTRQRAEQDGR